MRRLNDSNRALSDRSGCCCFFLIEVKGIGDTDGSVLLSPNERRVAEDRRACYWLYVVTHCNTTPQLREPIKAPARLQWTEVVKVAHYRIDTQNLSRRHLSPSDWYNS